MSKSQTNNQLHPGIWADDSDNDEDERPSFKSHRKNYSAPIGFVAGGVQQAGKKEEKKEEEDDDEPTTSFKTRDSSESDEDIPRPGITFNYINVGYSVQRDFIQIYT